METKGSRTYFVGRLAALARHVDDDFGTSQEDLR